MNQEKRKLAEGVKDLTQDQRDQLAVDAMLPKLSPRGWERVKDYMQGCLRELAEGKEDLTKDQNDQLAVDAMLRKLSPRGWVRVKDHLQGCLGMAEEDELESNSA